MIRFKSSFVTAALAVVVVSSAQAATIDVFRFDFEYAVVGALTAPASSVAAGVSANWTTPNNGVQDFGTPWGKVGVLRHFSAMTYQSIAFTTPAALNINSLSFWYQGNSTREHGYPAFPSYDVSVFFGNNSLGTFTVDTVEAGTFVMTLSGPGWVAAGNHEITWIVPAFTGSTESRSDYMALDDVVLTAAVPEIDPNSLGSVLAMVAGSLGLLERRRLKAA
jgi:hypothetical protein